MTKNEWRNNEVKNCHHSPDVISGKLFLKSTFILSVVIFFSFQSVIENSKFFEQYDVTYQILKRAAEMYAKANGSGKCLCFFHHGDTILISLDISMF